jgi:hypothetical protein
MREQKKEECLEYIRHRDRVIAGFVLSVLVFVVGGLGISFLGIPALHDTLANNHIVGSIFVMVMCLVFSVFFFMVLAMIRIWEWV